MQRGISLEEFLRISDSLMHFGMWSCAGTGSPSSYLFHLCLQCCLFLELVADGNAVSGLCAVPDPIHIWRRSLAAKRLLLKYYSNLASWDRHSKPRQLEKQTTRRN